MGGIFLRRREIPAAEFINDASKDVYNLFRILQEHYQPFLEHIRYKITTQAGFERLLKVEPETLTDIQRAARFLYLQRVAFGGKVEGRTFGFSAGRPGRFNLATLEPDLEALHDRLSGVTVLNTGYSAFIKRCDRPDTLFYLDPPYWGTEDYYGKALFSRQDFGVLARVLGDISGRFLMSINDVPEIRHAFHDFQITEVKTTYAVNGRSGGKKAGELIISNFKFEGL